MCYSANIKKASPTVVVAQYKYKTMIVVAVVVDLYSASRSASNALNVSLRRKRMSFQRRSEAVGTPSRVPERV